MNKSKEIRLSVNENPNNILGSFKEELTNLILNIDFNRYPSGDSYKLRSKIASYIDVDMDKLICTNGSDELIKVIIDTFALPGDLILSHSPTFVEYQVMADIRKCDYREIKPLEDFKVDIDGIINEANEKNAKLIFVCSPNNPTGELIPKEELIRVLDSVNAYVAIDEAYYEFSEQTIASLVDKYDKLIVLRTFSKALGLASIRVGYGIANTELINKMNKVRMPYNLNYVSEEIAALAVDKIDSFLPFVKEIISERNRLYEELSDISDLKVYKSSTNFILFKPNDKDYLYDTLKSNNILIKKFDNNPLLDQYLRFSMGTKEENDKLMEIIRRCHGE
jgi:histidinol-phosphate aminotransferase